MMTPTSGTSNRDRRRRKDEKAEGNGSDRRMRGGVPNARCPLLAKKVV
jgi:hypothetical protein